MTRIGRGVLDGPCSPDERSEIRDRSNTAPDIAALIRATWNPLPCKSLKFKIYAETLICGRSIYVPAIAFLPCARHRRRPGHWLRDIRCADGGGCCGNRSRPQSCDAG